MDATAFFFLRHERAHGVRIDETLEGLTEDELRRRPHPALNSIAWLFWHIARTEDLSVNRFVGDRSQVLDDEEWMPRLGIYRRDIGLGMTYDEVDDLSRRVNLDALRSYWGLVGRRTVDVVTALTPDDFDGVNEGPHVRRVIFDEGAIQGEHKEGVLGLWSGMTRGYALAYMGLTHNFDHLSDMGVIRGLWGHLGRWSPRVD
jgi:DinB superfamily